MALHNNPQVDGRSELVREEHASESIVNRFIFYKCNFFQLGSFQKYLHSREKLFAFRRLDYPPAGG